MVRTMWAGTDLYMSTNLSHYHHNNIIIGCTVMRFNYFFLDLGMDIYPLPSISLRI